MAMEKEKNPWAMSIDDLLTDCGGFGRFQVWVIFGVLVHKLTLGWSMLQMSYAGFIPDWHCELDPDSSWNGSLYSNQTLKKCTIDCNMTGQDQPVSCFSHRFEGAARTVINEWDLVCDWKWVKAAVTSVQMLGALFGAAISGRVSDIVGRRATLFAFSLLHCLFNIATSFSSSWKIFTAFRFCIGTGIGGVFVIILPYPLEFLPIKWRPVLPCIPVWTMSVGIFSVAALFLNNWAHLHLALGVFGMPAMIGYFFLPESVRWLTISGRHHEAETVFLKMAKVNRAKPPENMKAVLRKVYEEEREHLRWSEKYTYWDLLTGRETVPTLVFCYLWFMISVTYYGISFGVSALSGNLYLNIFLLALVEAPGLMCTFYLNNKFGRKKTILALFFLSTLASGACLAVQFKMSPEERGNYVTIFNMVTKLGVGTAWGVLQVWCSELYPTVVRNMSYGLFNSLARVGGIVAPFALNLDDRQVLSYLIMTSLLALAFLVSFLVRETKGLALADSFEDEELAWEKEHRPPGDSKSPPKKTVTSPVNPKKTDDHEAKTVSYNTYTYIYSKGCNYTYNNSRFTTDDDNSNNDNTANANPPKNDNSVTSNQPSDKNTITSGQTGEKSTTTAIKDDIENEFASDEDNDDEAVVSSKHIDVTMTSYQDGDVTDTSYHENDVTATSHHNINGDAVVSYQETDITATAHQENDVTTIDYKETDVTASAYQSIDGDSSILNPNANNTTPSYQNYNNTTDPSAPNTNNTATSYQTYDNTPSPSAPDSNVDATSYQNYNSDTPAPQINGITVTPTPNNGTIATSHKSFLYITSISDPDNNSTAIIAGQNNEPSAPPPSYESLNNSTSPSSQNNDTTAANTDTNPDISPPPPSYQSNTNDTSDQNSENPDPTHDSNDTSDSPYGNSDSSDSSNGTNDNYSSSSGQNDNSGSSYGDNDKSGSSDGNNANSGSPDGNNDNSGSSYGNSDNSGSSDGNNENSGSSYKKYQHNSGSSCGNSDSSGSSYKKYQHNSGSSYGNNDSSGSSYGNNDSSGSSYKKYQHTSGSSYGNNDSSGSSYGNNDSSGSSYKKYQHNSGSSYGNNDNSGSSYQKYQHNSGSSYGNNDSSGSSYKKYQQNSDSSEQNNGSSSEQSNDNSSSSDQSDNSYTSEKNNDNSDSSDNNNDNADSFDNNNDNSDSLDNKNDNVDSSDKNNDNPDSSNDNNDNSSSFDNNNDESSSSCQKISKLPILLQGKLELSLKSNESNNR